MAIQHPCLLRYVCEGPVAVVPIEGVAAEVGYEQVVKAVIVKIAHGDAGSPTAAGQPCFPGHVAESAVAIILIKPVVCAGGFAIDAAAAEQEDVGPPILIVVDESRATADRLENVLFAVCAAEDDRRAQPCGGGDVGKSRVERES